MKVYMLNPPFMIGYSRSVRGCGETTRGGTLYYPIWLSYAASLLEQCHKVRLVDAQARHWDTEEVLKDVNSFDPNLIIIDTNFSSLNNDIEVAKAIKAVSTAPVVFVGPPASQYFTRMLNSNYIDLVARYEYDYTLKELADAIENDISLDQIRGISYRENKQIKNNPDRNLTSSEDLNAIPFVSKIYKKHLNIWDYFLSSSFYPTVQVLTGRGCPNQCTFCSWPKTLMGRKYRYRSVSDVLDEFEYIIRELPDVKEIFIEDDTFTINKKRVNEFCIEYINRGLDIIWACNARATLDYDTMKEMKQANCRLLIVGYESGSDKILRNIKKGVCVEQNRSFSKSARKANLLVHGDFIIGLPGETEETIAMTRELIKEIRPEILQVLIPQPIPGTDLYACCKRNGYLLEENPENYLDKDGHQKSIISYPELSNEMMIKHAGKILKNYYLSPNYVPLALRQIIRKNGFEEAKRLLHSTIKFFYYVKNEGK
jgi:anaerobic magnesium-protoporphyrin IX monomethyl ester cyclase